MSTAPSATAAAPPGGYGRDYRTSVFERISYGMGDVACNVVFALTSGLVVYFYTNVVGVSAGLVGTILLLSRVFDGISDLAMAQVMDKTRSRHGKARVWLLWMSAPYGLSAIALFAVPAHAASAVQAVYIFVTYNLCTTVVYTALNLPYSSLAPLMTREDQDLARLNLFRMSMSPIGNMIVTACTLPFIRLLGGDQRAWVTVTVIYSVIAFSMLIWTFLVCKERFHDDATARAESLPFLVRLRTAGSNRYFLILLLTMIAVSVYQNVNGTVSTYYAQYVLGNAELMGVIQTAERIPWILGIMVMAPAIRRLGKRNLVLGGACLCVAAQIAPLLAPSSLPLVTAAAVVRGIGEAPFYGCIFTMIADTIDFGHWRTGVRVHALLFSAFTVGQKFGTGVAGWAVGRLMDASGFTGLTREIPAAVDMVRHLYIWGPILAWTAVVLLMLAYRLDPSLPAIQQELAERDKQEESK
ncbi:MFS transporter [Actinomyces sp.]|uniref:MFS transporter n=1 Tax=Actinomyces sp. TaxID=29317 RepID=UPI0026DBB13D|nr:glycoside-pentoside-hexuronide (GPH):cation symporter [Actinomyces sp.]MDO4901634.1 glycoside-pentoside-hexuronide (GPH):cation symporter [Actinomyces sp.]